MNAFPDKYLQDWNIKVEREHLDAHVTPDGSGGGGVWPPQLRRAPTVTLEFRGKPVTLTEQPQGKMRVAVWMPGEEMRTRPLLEELFTSRDFYDLAMAAATRQTMPGSHEGITAAFCIWWAQKNDSRIQEAEDRRRYVPTSFTDLGDATPFATSEFKGEDGKTYTQIDPVLTAALDARNREKQAEQDRRDQRKLEELARQTVAEEQLASIPGFGSF